MAIAFLVPGFLRSWTGGRSRLEIAAGPGTVGEALAALGKEWAGVVDRVLQEDGSVRPHVNLFVGSESIRYTGGLGTAVRDGAEIAIIPAVSGG